MLCHKAAGGRRKAAVPKRGITTELCDLSKKEKTMANTEGCELPANRRFAAVSLLDRNVDNLHARIREHVETQRPLDNTSYFLLATAARLLDEANNNLKAYNKINAV